VEEVISADKILLNLDNVVARRPITADIFLTDYCNNRCPYCTYARYGETNGRYIRFDDFTDYVEILLDMGVKAVVLTGGGEPTLNPDFLKITRWLEDSNVPYGINTNFNRYVEFSPNYLKVSLDAWNEDVYQAKRGVRAYSKAVENICRYADWKEQNGVKTRLGIQLVVGEVSEITSFYEANRGLPVDYIVFRPMESVLGRFYAGKDVQDEMAVIEGLRKKDSRVVMNYKWHNVDTVFDRCYAHDLSIALDMDGNVIYCCHKPYEKVCHIRDKGVLARYREAVTDMSMCDVPCRLTGPNEIIRMMDNSDKTDRGFI